MVCGDSFCGDKANKPDSWVAHLSSALGAPVDSFGKAGCSNYYILKQYINNNYKEYDIAIIIKTDNARIPYVNGMPGKSWAYDIESIENNNIVLNNMPDNYHQDLKSHLKYFHNFDLNEDISDYSFCKIAHLKPQYQKIIWLAAMGDFFDFPLFSHNIPSNSTFITGTLSNISDAEINHDGYKNQFDFSRKNFEEYKKKLNHLSPENNYNLALFLKNVILNENANRDLSKHNWTFN